MCAGCPSRIRTSVHGSKVRCPTTRRRGNDPSSPQMREWSGRRDSNPRPSHWQCDALPTEPLPHRSTFSGAESQIRTGDTALFRRVLYQLSYLGPLAACHGDLKHQLGQDTLRGERAQRRATWFVLGVWGCPFGLWWAVRGSNPRPPRCKRGALPTELTARCSRPPATALKEVWCPDRDLNPDDLRHTPLKRTRIPIPPPGHRCCVTETLVWYRGRDLNPYVLADTGS